MSVMTVRGPVPAADLGRTMMHEHLALDLWEGGHNVEYVLDDPFANMDDLCGFRELGGGTIVDCTTRGMGRDVGVLERLSQLTGIHVVAGTGYYVEPFYPQEVYQRASADLAEVMIEELAHGIDGTTIRAGIIGEIGTERAHISPAGERVLRAAARAHRATGCAITTHTTLGRLALQQIGILREEGVDPGKIVIGHLDNYPDAEYHADVARTGVYVQYDCVGKEYLCSDDRRAQLVAEMIHRGFERQLLLSSDICRRSNLVAFGGFGYQHLLKEFVPRVLRHGVSPESIETILVANPARVLDV